MIALLLSLALAAAPADDLGAQLDAAGLRPAPTDPWPAWAQAGGWTRVDGRCVPLRRTYFGQLEAELCPTDHSACGASFEPGGAVTAIPCEGADSGDAWILAEVRPDRIHLQPAWRARLAAPVTPEARWCAGPTSAKVPRPTRTCDVAGQPRLEVDPYAPPGRPVAADVALPPPAVPTDPTPVDCAIPCPPLPAMPSAPGPLLRAGDARATVFRDRAACEAATDAGELPFLAAATCVPD